MRALRQIFERAGCSSVRSYIQSGNVVYRAPARVARTLAREVSAAVQEEFGFSVPIVTRTWAEMQVIGAASPFPEAEQDRLVHIAFLADRPQPGVTLDPERSPGDRFILRDREVCLHCPNGVHKSKFSNAYLERTLGSTCTMRNWRTVEKLVEMMRTLP